MTDTALAPPTRPAEIVAAARFDPKLRGYLLLSSSLALAATIVGAPLLLLWIPLGRWWAGRYFESLACELTERTVVVRRGTVFRREMTIPLDKIQDISLREGPLLRALGLCTLRIETAGQSSNATGSSEADLTGIVDPRDFRDRVLRQREEEVTGTVDRATSTTARISAGAPDPVLIEIRDTLRSIEAELRRR